jgi:protein-S-isoprenylcysteine O-methyltransferase Ste14
MTLGQFVVWPTIPTAIVWPLLAILYFRQAKREEAVLSEKFGERFQEYARKTPMFLPRIPVRRRPKPTSP